MILVSPIPTPADGTVYASFIWRINSATCDRRHFFDDWLPVFDSMAAYLTVARRSRSGLISAVPVGT
jgi:hypothetical protein